MDEEISKAEAEQRKKCGFSIGRSTIVRRQAAPTGTSGHSSSTARKRRQETMQAACAIHGGSSSDTAAATIGMVETLETRSKEEDIVMAVRKTKKLKGKVLAKLYKEDLGKFEGSNDNMLRSIACYYSNGVMGRAKYRSVYKATSFRNVSKTKRAVRIKVANCPSPKLVPYHRLMSYIKSIEIGKLYDVRGMLCDGLDESEKVNGCYRELEELILKLAEFYLNSDQYNILTFDEPNTFHIALGGDGAPFGKDDTACSWLVSFLNIGQHILSRNENFLLFGANCSENCLPVKRFITKLMSDISHIKKKSYSVLCKGEPVVVKFVIGELPNDMKMLAFLGGELTNSATYFSTFADVSKDSIVNCKGTFGPHPTDTWKPWDYAKRVKDADAVKKFKKMINPNLASTTKRNKVTAFIAKQKSRQEFIPLVADLISKAHIEPLHLKNNACALAHRLLLKLAISWSNLSTSISTFSQVPPQSIFFKYVDSLKSKCGLNRLAKRIVRWFNDTGANGKDFDYRFTGKDSRMFLHNFMFLISVLEGQAITKSQQAIQIVHIHACLCLSLRNAVSLFSRVNISDEEVSELKTHCRNFYRGYCLYFNVNPTVWSLGNVVPLHTQEMKTKYGLGLGLNSMEGREAKHIAIAKYCANTAYLYRWEQVFRHEYISLIWLRQQGYNAKVKTATSSSYVPKRTKTPEFCNCGFNKLVSDNICRFCSHELRRRIKESIENCQVIKV